MSGNDKGFTKKMSFYKSHLTVLYCIALLFTLLPSVENLKIAVIGAGASGLTSLKWCLEEGFSVDVFEQTGSIGGVWNFSNHTTDVDENGLPVYSVMYKDLITNLPKDLMELSDFPYPDIPRSFLPSERVWQYFHDYADHFNLLPHIQFYKQVTKVEPLRDTEWKLTVRNANTGLTEVKDYDAVLICNGHYFREKLPRIPGMESFKGKQLHSRRYRSPYGFENKTVLIVGAGSSGADIASKLSLVAEKVILSHKPPLFWKVSSGIAVKPVVTNISEKIVTFEDYSKNNVDVIIYCTGFAYDFSFLAETCGIKEENRWIKYLYKHIINVKHPTMAAIGVLHKYCSIPVNELQVKFFIAHLKKSIPLPSEESMMDDIMDRLGYIKRKRWTERQFHLIALDQATYCDDLAKIANITPIHPVLNKLFTNLYDPEYSDNKDVYYKIIDSEHFVIV